MGTTARNRLLVDMSDSIIQAQGDFHLSQQFMENNSPIAVLVRFCRDRKGNGRTGNWRQQHTDQVHTHFICCGVAFGALRVSRHQME